MDHLKVDPNFSENTSSYVHVKCTNDIEPSVCQCDLSFSSSFLFGKEKRANLRSSCGVKARFIPPHSSSFFAMLELIPLAQGQTNSFVFKLHFRVSEHWLPAVERVNLVFQESICAASCAFASWSDECNVIYETSIPLKQ